MPLTIAERAQRLEKNEFTRTANAFVLEVLRLAAQALDAQLKDPLHEKCLDRILKSDDYTAAIERGRSVITLDPALEDLARLSLPAPEPSWTFNSARFAHPDINTRAFEQGRRSQMLSILGNMRDAGFTLGQYEIGVLMLLRQDAYTKQRHHIERLLSGLIQGELPMILIVPDSLPGESEKAFWSKRLVGDAINAEGGRRVGRIVGVGEAHGFASLLSQHIDKLASLCFPKNPNAAKTLLLTTLCLNTSVLSRTTTVSALNEKRLRESIFTQLHEQDFPEALRLIVAAANLYPTLLTPRAEHHLRRLIALLPVASNSTPISFARKSERDSANQYSAAMAAAAAPDIVNQARNACQHLFISGDGNILMYVVGMSDRRHFGIVPDDTSGIPSKTSLQLPYVNLRVFQRTPTEQGVLGASVSRPTRSIRPARFLSELRAGAYTDVGVQPELVNATAFEVRVVSGKWNIHVTEYARDAKPVTSRTQMGTALQ